MEYIVSLSCQQKNGNDLQKGLNSRFTLHQIDRYNNHDNQVVYSFISMPKVFSGSEHIRILFKYGKNYKLTQNIPSSDTYTETLNNVITQNKIDVISTRLLKYQMVRNEKNKQLNTFAIILVEVKAEPTLKNIGWSNQASQIQGFVKAISPNLPGLQVFADEGSQVQLVK